MGFLNKVGLLLITLSEDDFLISPETPWLIVEGISFEFAECFIRSFALVLSQIHASILRVKQQVQDTHCWWPNKSHRFNTPPSNDPAETFPRRGSMMPRQENLFPRQIWLSKYSPPSIGCFPRWKVLFPLKIFLQFIQVRNYHFSGLVSYFGVNW